ncbi:hypothetical protein N9489_04215 [Methylophilaceae bacterium]|jgi:hypothetical protein|nr:hypothetical protein [Nitrosomonadales bacterium]MDB4040633.1 hypothetical protein [Methylophilaceae bacterium]|tara:strand:- start:323 stop:733 length:411 start_codon:yes stop_codon:yes gene_type:complete
MEPIKKLFQAKVFYEYGKKKSELDILQNEFLSNISDKIRPYAKVKDRVGDILVIEVTNNTVGHKIKIVSSSILKTLSSSSSLKLKKIKIKIAVQNPTAKRKINKTSISTINQMKNLSNEISDSPLKTYLKKIFQNK